MADKGPTALSIGIVLGGTAEVDRIWRPELTRLAKEVVAARADVGSDPLRVNVVFHIDGTQSPNEFHGVRTGRFSRRDQHLMVQAAVPPASVQDQRSALLSLLYQAVDEAEAYAGRRRIADGLPVIRAILASLPED
jgi:hypothetical protein